jgi:hypothetical protein
VDCMKTTRIFVLITEGVIELFDGPRYITKGVNESINIFLQLAIWDMISSIPCEKDYLQIFKLSSEVKDGKKIQIICQSQEVPPYEKTFSFYCEEPVTAKLFCIDSEEYSTMLLAEEY